MHTNLCSAVLESQCQGNDIDFEQANTPLRTKSLHSAAHDSTVSAHLLSGPSGSMKFGDNCVVDFLSCSES